MSQACEFVIPGSFPSVANLREHWSAKAKRTQVHRWSAAMLAIAALRDVPTLADFAGTVTLTRCAPRKLDSDNLASALKGARDGIAQALGVDDGDPRVTWRYEQEPCRNGEQSVRVVVEAARG